MRVALLAIVLFFYNSAIIAQVFPSELWHEGKLVLISQDTLQGKIKYDLDKGIVQIEAKDKIYTYSAKNIFYFKILDATTENYREFYVLPYGIVTSYKTPVIFEVLVEGNITLLSREFVMVKNVQNPYSYGSYATQSLAFEYYFLDRDGEITKYSNKKSDLLAVFGKYQSQVASYMKANRLRYDNRNDLIRIFAFYNALL